MARFSAPGNSEVHWVTTIATVTAATAAELNAGTDVTSDMPDIPDIPRTANLVDIADLSSKFESRQVGTRGGDVASFPVFRDTATETGYDTLAEDTAGFLVIARKPLATTGTFATGDVVDIYPATVAASADPAPGRNGAVMAAIEIAITAEPSRNQTV